MRKQLLLDGCVHRLSIVVEQGVKRSPYHAYFFSLMASVALHFSLLRCQAAKGEIWWQQNQPDRGHLPNSW